MARPRSIRGKAAGLVSVGPVDVNSESAFEILRLALPKFGSNFQMFDLHQPYSLVYKDGRHVDKLPDGSQPFTLRGYKDFCREEQYDRIQLYLCEGT